MFKQHLNIKPQYSVAHSPTLSRYVKKNAFFSILFAVLGLWLLQLIFSYLAQLEDLTDSYSYMEALQYIAYRSPYFLEQFIPTGALLGAVVGLGLLANNSEIVVMRAAGVSIYRIVAWVLQPALLFVLMALGVNQFVLPHTNQLASQIRDPDTPLLSSVDGYWTLRDLDNGNGNGNGNRNVTENGSNSSSSKNNKLSSEIIFIDYADANGNIGTVKRWQIKDNYTLVSASKASGGHYVESTSPNNDSKQGKLEDKAINTSASYQWQLNDLSEVRVNQDIEQALATQAPLLSQETRLISVINLPIAPSSIYLLTRRAEDLSLTELYEHHKFNSAQGFRSLEHELAFWQKLLSPFAILSLVIIACSFVFGSLRTHSLGLRIVVSLLFGLLFSYMQDLTGFVSLATGVSPLLMVSLPIVISAILGVILLKRQM